MAKEIDKIIQSKTAPKSTNVLWDNGENLNIYRNGKWESTGGGAPMINITYANLVELRNNNKLIAGMQYRITDYVTTTAQENTQSAGHQFDVIVTADNENTLNEVARTCLHDGDIYFSEHGAKLEAWQIWYSLDNDTERFAWATKTDYTIHVPVSDYTREVLRGILPQSVPTPDTLIFTWWDAPRNGSDGYGLDFYKATNIRFGGDDALMIAFPCGTIPQSGIEFNETILTSYGDELQGNCFYFNGYPTDVIIDTLPTVINNNIGKGVIYRMIDEWNNDCPYDFKNILFVRKVNDEGNLDESTNPSLCYTFSWRQEDKTIIDYSIHGNNGTLRGEEGVANVSDNHIGVCCKVSSYFGENNSTSLKCYLNNIVFFASYSFEGGLAYPFANNRIASDCLNFTLLDCCKGNHVDSRCQNIVFKQYCTYNHLYVYVEDIVVEGNFLHIGNNTEQEIVIKNIFD